MERVQQAPAAGTTTDDLARGELGTATTVEDVGTDCQVSFPTRHPDTLSTQLGPDSSSGTDSEHLRSSCTDVLQSRLQTQTGSPDDAASDPELSIDASADRGSASAPGTVNVASARTTEIQIKALAAILQRHEATHQPAGEKVRADDPFPKRLSLFMKTAGESIVHAEPSSCGRLLKLSHRICSLDSHHWVLVETKAEIATMQS